MKFTSLPKNGSSWYDQLLYGIDTELSEPTDVEISIQSISGNVEYGTMRLYGVTTAMFNIAPYLLNSSNIKPYISKIGILNVSRPSLEVKVVANGVESEPRILSRTPFEEGVTRDFSLIDSVQQISLGEHIILTLYTPTSSLIDCTITTPDDIIKYKSTQRSNNKIMDVVIPTASFNKNATMLDIELSTDSTPIKSLRYIIVKRDESARRLLWFNSIGGLECYTFPKSRIRSIEASISQTSCGNNEHNRLHKALKIRELCSAIESEKECERLSEIVCSPYVYMIDGCDLIPVTIHEHKLTFDTQHLTRQLIVAIEEEQKGGIRC